MSATPIVWQNIAEYAGTSRCLLISASSLMAAASSSEFSAFSSLYAAFLALSTDFELYCVTFAEVSIVAQ